LDLVALGSSDDITDGIARLTVEDHGWQEVVRRLVDQAALIIALPLFREGTVWEMQLLKANSQFHKTVFLIPEMYRQQPGGVWVPKESDRAWDAGIYYHNPSEHHFDIVSEWKLSKQMLNLEGYILPPYLQDGAFFTLDQDTGRVDQISPLPLSMLNNKRGYILSVLVAFGLIPSTPKSNTDLLAALEDSTFPNNTNQEYILTLAFRFYLSIGDAETASAIFQRLNQIVHGRTLIVHQMIEVLPAMFADPEQHDAVLSEFEELKLWLNTLRKVNGIDNVRVDAAYQTLLSVHSKRKDS
jgi:hypothetical protein